jgi:hypothetical protein
MRILNLYAGIGGNRALWGDEHQYLIDHYKEYDFIWSSPMLTPVSMTYDNVLNNLMGQCGPCKCHFKPSVIGCEDLTELTESARSNTVR